VLAHGKNTMNNNDYSTTAPDFNGVSGLVSLAVDAGLPLDLALPIEPPYLHLPIDDKRRQHSGKKPAALNAIGEWQGLSDWTNTPVHPEVLRDAGLAGCNVGVRLGVASQEPSGLHLLALDVDLNEGHADTCKTLLRALQPLLGGIAFIWRETKPGRALCLVHLTELFDSRKRVWRVACKGTDIGKIELLANGQQCVVAGRHWTGREILWRCAGEPGTAWPVPPLNRVPLPSFPDQDAVVTMLTGVWQSLASAGYEFIDSAGGGTGGNISDQDKAPAWLTLDILLDAVKRLENGKDVDRDKYVSVSQRIAASRWGIIAHHGAWTPEQEEKLADAYAGWASQHVVLEHRADFEAEKAKWQNDWVKRGQQTSWDALVRIGRDLGVDLIGEAAQREFSAEPRPRVSESGFRVFQTHAGDWDVAQRSGEMAYQFQHYASEDEAWNAIHEYEQGQNATATGSALPDFEKMAERPALIIEYAGEFSVEAGLPLVDGWVDQGELVAIIGAPGSYKTTLMADLAGCIAWERPWMGCKTAGGAILVVELEGARGFRNRVIAWHKHHGLDFRKAPIGMVSQGITLTEGANGEDTRRVIDAAKSVAEKTGLPLRLIMIDTMSRVIAPGKSEDSASDISGLVQAVGEIQRQTGAAVALIHHVGLTDGTRGRGSSNQRASWDVELLVQAEGMFGTVSAPKQREKEQLPPIPFAAVVVEIGNRQDGKTISACVTRLAEQGEIPNPKTSGPKAQGPKFSMNEGRMLKTMQELREKWEPLPKGPAFPPSGAGLPKAIVQEWFNRKLVDVKTEAGKRGSFSSGIKGLTEKGILEVHDDWYWLTGQPGAEFTCEAGL
jgi:energy-coupling factor transporter ATP-binding protein EcfA2